MNTCPEHQQHHYSCPICSRIHRESEIKKLSVTGYYVRRIRHYKYGIENPVGFQVALTYKGKDLLGDVKGYRYNHARGCFELLVNHFSGEPWPLEPISSAVEVLADAQPFIEFP